MDAAVRKRCEVRAPHDQIAVRTPAATRDENRAEQAVHAKLTKPRRKTSPQGEQPHRSRRELQSA